MSVNLSTLTCFCDFSLEPLQTVFNKVFLRPVMSNLMEDSLFCPVAPHLSPPQAGSLSPLLSLCLSLSLPPFT